MAQGSEAYVSNVRSANFDGVRSFKLLGQVNSFCREMKISRPKGESQNYSRQERVRNEVKDLFEITAELDEILHFVQDTSLSGKRYGSALRAGLLAFPDSD